MLCLKSKKLARVSSKLAAISAAVAVLIVSFGINEFIHGGGTVARPVVGVPATARFESTAAEDEDSSLTLGSPGRRGQSISLMIFRLN
ncbi:MAG TPA: hypothetical protein VI566_05575 [Xanthomonadales bacterium]|nr:hypothetical protein [Xanthomonadales bacterium]